jgi:hypothetical protein
MKRTILAMIIAMSILMTVGTVVAPTSECDCGDYEFKIDDWNQDADGITMNGTYNDVESGGDISIIITNSDDFGYTFDWSSNKSVCAVVVKAGNTPSKIYSYPSGSTGDTGLTADINPSSGNLYQISHVTFCYSEDGGQQQDIPEFPTIALPIVAILGLAFFFQRRKE